MKYDPTTKSAIEFANAGKIEQWVHTFLCNDGGNVSFSEGLKLEPRTWYAPELMCLNLFQRCCGPEDGMKFQTPDKGFYDRVNSIARKFQTGLWDMPPLIIQRTNNGYELNDGNHRFEALKQLGINKYWVIIWETSASVN